MRKDKLVVIITIGIVCFLLALVIFMQFKVTKETRETNIDTMQEAELRQQLANWKTQYDDIKQKNDEIQNTINSYNEESFSDNKTRETLEQELSTLEMALGLTDVEGPGVIITLTEKKQSELAEDEDITPIYAEDLIQIINYLKDAGAEAISINDERVVNTTDIVDLLTDSEKISDIIKMNSKHLRTRDYTIKAIGNSSYLESSIFGKGGYVEQLDISGIKATIEKSNKVKILKFTGDYNVNYIEEDK